MRKSLLVLPLLAAFFLSVSCAQQSYVIGFYNVENLFDTVHDHGKKDGSYLPDGEYHWTPDKYAHKLGNIARVISEMKKRNGAYHAVLGLAEVENISVLRDLVARPEIADAGFVPVLHEGPDARGVDVALLYDPSRFQFIDSESIRFDFRDSEVRFTTPEEDRGHFRTRDILMVRGRLGGSDIAVYVAHLPSRGGGKGADLRARGAEIIYRHSRALEQKCPGIKIVVMGDMNDDPADESMTVWLHSKSSPTATAESDFFSPFIDVHASGTGTLTYKGAWNLFDNILVNSSLAKGPGLHIRKTGSFYGAVFNADFLTEQEGPYAGSPFRSFAGGRYIGGFSDHYPTYITVSR